MNLPSDLVESERARASSTSTIAPCPFCGKTCEDMDPATCVRAVAATTYPETKSSVVQCNWCGMSGPIFDTVREAIAAWNTLKSK